MPPTTLMTRTCENCGVEIVRRKNQIRNKKWIACSKDCWKQVKSRATTKHDLVGTRFGSLVVTGRSVGGVEYVCDCGKAGKTRHVEALLSGQMRSCGCRKPENMSESLKTHGGASIIDTSLRLTHNSWRSMRLRCYNANQLGFHRWGGRGITMCDRWRDDFAAFLADMGERPIGHTIDRIDPDGNYTPENCRWATPVVQARNTRARKASASSRLF